MKDKNKKFDLSNLKGIKSFFRIAHEHEISIHPKLRYIGIVFILFGWFLLGLDANLSYAFVNKVPLSVAFFWKFSGALMLWLLGTVVFCICRGFKTTVRFFRPNEPHLVFLRAFLGIVTYYLYSYSRIWVAKIDNAVLFSADALFVPLILKSFLKKKFPWLVWVGISIGFLGVAQTLCKNLHYDFGGMKGAACGVISAALMAMIIIMTSYMVKSDPPLRIAFYQILFGFVIFGALSSFEWVLPSFNDALRLMLSGCLFGVALFFFLDAFFYTESYIIATLGYSLIFFTTVLDWMLNAHPQENIVISGLMCILLGGLMTVLSPYFSKNKK